MPSRHSLRALIGGRWAVSWQGYLLASPFGIGLVFLSVPSIWSADSLLSTLLLGTSLGVVSYLPAGLVLWLAAITVLKHRATTPAPLTLVALTGAVAWAARSLVVIAYVDLQPVSSGPSPAARMALSALQGVAAVLASAWLFAKLDEFAQQRRLLLHQLVEEELATEALSESVAALRNDVRDSVRKTIHRSMRSESTSGAETPPEREVNAFREQATRVSRDLARELWASAERRTRLRPMALVRFAVANRPFAYWALAPGVVMGLLALPSYWPAPVAFVSTIAVTIFALVVSAIGNRVIPRLDGRGALLAYALTVTLLVLGGGLTLLIVLSLDTVPSANAAGAALLAAAATGFQYPALSLAATIGPAQSDVLDRIRQSIDATEVRRASLTDQEARFRRELALALHNGLQADLTAASLRARQALDAGDTATALHVLNVARAGIDTALETTPPTAASLQDAVLAAVQAWTGLVEISTCIDVSRDCGARCAKAVGDVILEGIGNAVRHGMANTITISVEEHDSRLRVTVTDDGRGAGNIRAGLGSSMLNAIAPGAWSLTPRNGGGSVLDVVLPMT